MKVPSVVPAQAGIQAVFAVFRLKACRNDDAKVPKTFILRCDHQVMTVRRNDEKSKEPIPRQPPKQLFHVKGAAAN